MHPSVFDAQAIMKVVLVEGYVRYSKHHTVDGMRNWEGHLDLCWNKG